MAAGDHRDPVLLSAVSIIECVTQQVVRAGDHDLVLGRVVTLHPETGKRPLVFHEGEYHTLQ